MGLLKSFPRRLEFVAGITLVCLHMSVGCQNAPMLTSNLLRHQAFIDFSGLKDARKVDDVKVTAAPPETWDELVPKKAALYTHQQWRSPTRITGVGVAYIRLPVPLPLSTLVWFAKREYSKQKDEGRVIGEWTDKLGRTWFEAENNMYHVRGYAVVNGTDAWIVYLGYKVANGPNAAELSLGAKALETIIPAIPQAVQQAAAH